MTNPQNEQMPDNPGAPEATDPEYVSPDQAETLADEAAESEALATDEDPLLAADAELEDAAKIAKLITARAKDSQVFSPFIVWMSVIPHSENSAKRTIPKPPLK